jgi:hypothetical protein
VPPPEASHRKNNVMTTTDPNSFHDPDLKAAVHRVWGNETAPAALRHRVYAMGIGAARGPVAGITPEPARGRPAWTWPLRHPRPLYALAAALTMVLGFTVAYQIDRPATSSSSSSGGYARVVDPSLSNGPAAIPPTTLPSALPPSLPERLADAHARCVGYRDHDGFKDLGRSDFGSLRQQLENELGFSVLAGAIGDDESGWEFKGAAVCPVGQIASAHLLFARRGQAVSLFSLPRASCPQAKTGDVFEDGDRDHPMAVFVRPGGIQCVVGSSRDGSLTATDVRSIGDRLLQK